MKLIATRKADQSRAVLDPWTAVHFGAGIAAGMMGIGFAPAMVAAAAYEVAEQVIERTDAGRRLFKTSGRELAANVGADLLVMAAGWWLADRYTRS